MLISAIGYSLFMAVLAISVSGEPIRRARKIVRWRDERLADLIRTARDAFVESATHGDISSRIRTVVAVAPRLGTNGSAACHRLDLLERRVRESLDAQTALRGRGGIRSIEPTVFAVPDVDFVRESSAVRPYGTTANHPQWLPPRLSALLEQLGMVLDEVRALHTTRIERAVLALTFWSRLALLGLAPLLADASYGSAPLDRGFSVLDVPWIAALVVAAATAVSAPLLTSAVMDAGPRGARVRQMLIRVEMPIALALCLTRPTWATCAFAVGWTNYAQRPVFDWFKLARFLAAVGSAEALGMALHGAAAWQIGVELAATFFVIAVTGGSYGAMLPVSATVFVQTLLAGRAGRYRAARAAREDLLTAATELEVVAAELRRERDAQTETEMTEALFSAEAAIRDLRHAAAELESGGGVAPSGLRAVVLTALRLARVPDILVSFELPPEERRVVALEPEYAPRELATRRVRSRANRRDLTQALRLLVEEARAHGEGGVSIRVTSDHELLRIAVANLQRADDVPGRGGGRTKIADLCRRLPGGDLLPARPNSDGNEFGRPGEPLYVAELVTTIAILT